MSIEEVDKLIVIVKKAIHKKRSKKEIIKTFENAGIITKSGNFKDPYKEIYIPAQK
ncbi:MAG TPA: hypothetical protein VK155_11560 [Bacteroidales bacterium]|jgi:hypothetical protein|nr:hypothetical protein [Bacteroidales bacterium]